MVDGAQSRLWANRALFVIVAAVIGFARLLPLDIGPPGLPGPQLLVLFAFAWVLRRPDYVPVAIVAIVFLTADLLFLRPPGLWTAMVVLGLEFLRTRESAVRDMGFLLEWAIVASVLSLMTLANTAVLTVFFVDQPPLGLILLQLIATAAFYPLVVLLTTRILGVRKSASGEADRFGYRS